MSSPPNQPGSTEVGLASCLIAAALLLFPDSSKAVDFTDDFDGVALDLSTWEFSGGKTYTVADGKLTFAADGGNWTSGDISSVRRYILPDAGTTTIIEWELGPGTIDVENAPGGQSLRYQFGIHSANETNTSRQHWTNTTGGLWLDLDVITLANTTGVAGSFLTADDTKVADTNGKNISVATISDWSWQAENYVIRLEITSTGFGWYSGEVLLVDGTFATEGIDTEFDNGYRVLALGMNFDGGRGQVSYDRISITDGNVSESLVTSFSSNLTDPVSSEPFVFSWITDLDATLSIDNDVGDVSDETIDGVGQIRLIAPVVTEPTQLDYVITATKGGEVDTKMFAVTVFPAPTPFTENLLDHFDGAELNSANWEHRGNKTFSVNSSLLNWNDDAGNWGHGEVDSVHIFPMPEPGKPTKITWTLGPADVTTEGPDGSSLRPMLGIYSSFERDAYSRQHWQNTTGGIWLDVTTMGNSRLDGIGGTLHHADDTKTYASNGPQLGSFDISGWNWKTESHAISLQVTDQGFTWLDGETELGSSTWNACFLDDELVNGFKILMMAGNWDTGRGPISLESIEVENGAAIRAPFAITSVDFDPDTSSIQITWNSEEGAEYALDFSTDLSSWEELDDSISSGGETSTHSETGLPTGRYYLRLRQQ